MDESILEPVKSYFDVYKDRHRQLTEEYFDRLVEQAGVSPEENAQLMKELEKAESKRNDADKHVRRLKSLRAFCIVCVVLLALGALFTPLALWDTQLQWVGILVACLGGAGAIALIVVICVVLNKKIREGNSVVDRHQADIDEIKRKAWEQMQPLNRKYDWNIPDGLIKQTVPEIQLDKYFDEDKFAYFAEKGGLSIYDGTSSVVCVRSGNSDGKPFLFTRLFRQDFVPHTYTGSRVVTWTEVEHDSKGYPRTVTHSDTLFATVVKPKPHYAYTTYLFYGCDSAPDLHFSRTPTVPLDADEKKLQSMIKKGEKELEKKARDAVNEGKSFNKLANSEFEVLFGAENRDNELEFRLMFTPLAQRNMVELLRSKQPYGDDFHFVKKGAINIIHSLHSAKLDIDASPDRFVDFNLARARQTFIEYNCDYFRSIYFDFAPLFCIPLYTQESNRVYFGECTKQGNIGNWEAEAVANHFERKLLEHPSSATPSILKVYTDIGESNTVAHVTAHSFEGIPQIDLIPVRCRNGNVYEVPVPWTQYLPIEQCTDIDMQAVQTTREQFIAEGNSVGTLLVSGIKATIK